MRTYLYTIEFTSGVIEEIYSFTEKQARILAQAQQIKDGNTYDIKSVTVNH